MKIKLVKSSNGQLPHIRATLKALGLTKLNKVVERPDNQALAGMVRTVRHLVKEVKQD